jgi:hypothetical protein
MKPFLTNCHLIVISFNILDQLIILIIQVCV